MHHLYSHLLIRLVFLQIKIYKTKQCLFSTTTRELRRQRAFLFPPADDYVYASESRMTVVSLQINRKKSLHSCEKTVWTVSFIRLSGCLCLGDITTDCIFQSAPPELRAAARCVKGWLAPLMLLHVCIIDCERTVVDWLTVFQKENVQLVRAHHYSTRSIIERLNPPSSHAALRLALEWKRGSQLNLNLSQFCDFFSLCDSCAAFHLQARNKATMSNVRSHLTLPLFQLNKATGAGDGALFNYGDVLIVSASLKVGMAECYWCAPLAKLISQHNEVPPTAGACMWAAFWAEQRK